MLARQRLFVESATSQTSVSSTPYDGLDRVIAVVKRLGKTWRWEQLSDDLICEILNSAITEKEPWLSRMGDAYLSGGSCNELRSEIVAVLLEAGFLVARGYVSDLAQATDPMLGTPAQIEGGSFTVHRMFWSALGFGAADSEVISDGAA